MTVAAALRDPQSGLSEPSTFTRRPYDDRLRLETLAQPFIGAGTGDAFGGLIRASFGATFGDVLTKPLDRGGLNLGTIGSSIVLASILVTFIIYTTIKHQDVATRNTAIDEA